MCGFLFSKPKTTPVKVKYTVNGQETTEEFDYLVVACDPRGIEIDDRTDFEKEVVKQLSSHTFHTTLFSCTRPNREQFAPMGVPNGPEPQTNYCVRFDPDTLERMDGGVYGFRDEVMARDDELRPSPNKSTWCVTYQLEEKGLLDRNLDEVSKKLNEQRKNDLAAAKWVDWDKAEVSHEIFVDYFAHFESPQLKEGLPWKILDKQGEMNTLYVASFTCFESILHCYLYQNMLMEERHVKRSFPRNKDARIAVIGAGPAGLLFASQQLKAKGYDNFKIFESTERYGGKTVTEYRNAPAEPGRSVPCELGTCYLSSAYFPLYKLFEKYDVGKVVALDPADAKVPFRSIIDSTVARNEQEKLDGVEYDAWSTYLKLGLKDMDEGFSALAKATVMYVLYHVCALGMTPEDCMPKSAPSKFNAIKNVWRVLKWLKLSEDAQKTKRLAIANLFEGIWKGDSSFTTEDKELASDAQDFLDCCKKADVEIEIGEILSMFTIDPLNVTFYDFLDTLGMNALMPTLVYGYQVQGYGTLTRIPAYYGLIWITPASFLQAILDVIAPAAPGSDRANRGYVNVMSKGWLNVWTQIVEKDKLEPTMQMNTSITSIVRG